jgi:zinc transport system permease protein
MALDSIFGDLPELLAMPFFQMALLGGCIIALICSTLGVFIVLRKEAMIGDSVAHTAFGGIALGLLLGIEPLLTALLVSTLAILGIAYMREKGVAHSDSAMAVMLAAGFSMGLIIVSLAGGFNVALMDYLFGSILTISSRDMLLMIVLGVIIFCMVMFLYKELQAITFDEKATKMNGVPVRLISVVFNILLAFTIVLSIKVVGIILVVALMVIPALTALQLRLSFRKTLMASMVFGVLSTMLGIMISGTVNIASSGVIVFTAVGMFLLVAAYQRLA